MKHRRMATVGFIMIHGLKLCIFFFMTLAEMRHHVRCIRRSCNYCYCCIVCKSAFRSPLWIHPVVLGSQKTPKQMNRVAWLEDKEVVKQGTSGQPGPRVNLPLVRSPPSSCHAFFQLPGSCGSHMCLPKLPFLIGLSLNQLEDADNAACPELNGIL